jgi:exonuclease I
LSHHEASFYDYNYENNQKDALYKLIYYSKSALHVSGDVFAHYQAHLAVFTVSGSVHPSCCWLAAVSNFGEHYQVL